MSITNAGRGNEEDAEQDDDDQETGGAGGTTTRGWPASTKWAAVCAMRRPSQAGQNPRRLYENATNFSWAQSVKRRRRNPWARMPIAVCRSLTHWAQTDASRGVFASDGARPSCHVRLREQIENFALAVDGPPQRIGNDGVPGGRLSACPTPAAQLLRRAVLRWGARRRTRKREIRAHIRAGREIAEDGGG